RVTFNPNDEEAVKRIINYPKRGIGDTTVERMMVAAAQHDTTLWNVISQPSHYLDGRSSAAVGVFSTMIQSFQVLAKTMNAFELAMHIAQQSGILKELYNDKSVEGEGRHENIQELLSGIQEFSEREDIDDRGLDVFMQDIALLTNDDKD